MLVAQEPGASEIREYSFSSGPCLPQEIFAFKPHLLHLLQGALKIL
jgi:hypothetical protein